MKAIKANSKPIKGKSSVLDSARAFGARQSGSSVLGEFAIFVAELVAKGEAGSEDARDLYEAYARAAQRVSKMDPSAQTFRVQASKLRQIMKMAEQLGDKSVPLLQEVKRTHRELYDRGKSSETAYHSMVRVAREVNKNGRAVPRTHIARILSK